MQARCLKHDKKDWQQYGINRWSTKLLISRDKVLTEDMHTNNLLWVVLGYRLFAVREAPGYPDLEKLEGSTD